MELSKWEVVLNRVSRLGRFNLLSTCVCLLSIVALAGMFHSCDPIEFSDDPAIELAFSSDTIFFDTVFTSVGSATYGIRIYNRSDKDVMIDEVSIDNDQSVFRFNIDGFQGPQVTEVPVFANDSIYLFCEVTIDPDQPLSVSPFVIQDEIRFVTNGNTQFVTLQAWGQNANYFPSKANRNNLALLTCDLGLVSWNDPKPYVIYGVLLIDSCTVQIPPGTQVYFHGSLANNDIGIYQEGFLITLPNGRLDVQGTLDEPVVFQGDRLESAFDETPGQWPGVRFGTGSRGNVMRHAVIRNSIVGIRADSSAEVLLDAVEIKHTSSTGVLGIHADITARNCLIYDNGQNGIQAVFGGNLEVEYTTIGSYGNNQEAVTLNNFFCYDPPICSRVNINTTNASFTNCVLAGNDQDEISMFDAAEDDGFFNYNFDHCIVRVNDLLDENRFPDFFDNCTACIELEFNDILFIDQFNGNYMPDTLSIAIEKAIPTLTTVDKQNKVRDISNPDIGCFEF